MKQVVVICGESKARCSQILELLSKRNKDIIINECVTTADIQNFGYKVVNNNKFMTMVEGNVFFEYHVDHNNFYGTLFIDNKLINDNFMISDTNVALNIKKIYPKTITIYILSEAEEVFFKTDLGNKNYLEAKKLDFLVVDNDLTDTAKKIEEIVSFINENGMK